MTVIAAIAIAVFCDGTGNDTATEMCKELFKRGEKHDSVTATTDERSAAAVVRFLGGEDLQFEATVQKTELVPYVGPVTRLTYETTSRRFWKATVTVGGQEKTFYNLDGKRLGKDIEKWLRETRGEEKG